jgi:tellurite resistance protein TehA-like permease
VVAHRGGPVTAAGSVVMATGIVSVALSLDGQAALSDILLVLAAASWGALGVVLVVRARRDPGLIRREARSPAALTTVAGSAVIGTRATLLGWSVPAVALLVIAVALWLVLIAPVLLGLERRTGGGALMLTVSTESLAVLAAELATHDHAPWLMDAALVPLLLGLALYLLVMARFDPRELVRGRGDHWVTGGALAISALAAGDIAGGAAGLHALGDLHSALKDLALGLWAAALAWLVPLVVSELLHRRPGYDVRRWSTVFPLGMYAACSFSVGAAISAPGLTDFARGWVWVALAAWALTFAAMVRRSLARVSAVPAPRWFRAWRSPPRAR